MPDVLNANGDLKENTMPKTISLQVELVNAILQYLGQRPFQEVIQLINGIQSEAGPQVKEMAEVMDVTGVQ